MAKIIYKNETFKIVDEENLQFQLDIKNAKRDSIYTYKYLTKEELIKLGYAWSEKSNRWSTTCNCIKEGIAKIA